MAKRVFTTRTCVRRRYATEDAAWQAFAHRANPLIAVHDCRDCGGWHLFIPDTAPPTNDTPLTDAEITAARGRLRRRWRRWRNR